MVFKGFQKLVFQLLVPGIHKFFLLTCLEIYFYSINNVNKTK
jgi:hypothetical protein